MHPQPCRQETDECGEDGAVGPVQPRPWTGAAQYGDLVPQYQQLGVSDADDRLSRTSQLHNRAKVVPDAQMLPFGDDDEAASCDSEWCFT